MTTSAPTPDQPVLERPSRDSLYARLWRGVPRELLFLLLGLPIAIAGFVVATVLFNTGVGLLIPLFVGVFLILGAMYVARGFGSVELTRLHWAAQPPIPRVQWNDGHNGFWAWLRSVFFNGHYWLAWLHTTFVNLIATVLSWTITVTWLALGLGGSSYWFWARFLPHQRETFSVSLWVFTGDGVTPPTFGVNVFDLILYLVLGLAFLASLPFVTRGLTRMHWGLAYALLGAWRSETLREQVRELSEARGAASSAEGHSLRRLERDIHDGPQQRLVRMQMDLAAADRQLDGDPAKARELIAGAMQQSKDALEELRALSRGFAPPILMDRGLIAALESAATRSPIPTTVLDKLPGDTAIPQEIERNAYFAASEALTNAIKHSGATSAEIRVGRSGDWLIVTVTDDGAGGAVTRPGHGLAGLAERMRGSGGTLDVHSPAGGPTSVSARLPL